MCDCTFARSDESDHDPVRSKVKAPLGLIPNWKQHTKSRQDANDPKRVLGGLKDSDAFAKRPKTKPSKSVAQVTTIRFDDTRDFSRKNQVRK